MRALRILQVAITGLVLAIPVHAELVVVVNPANPLKEMTTEQVAQLYTGTMTAFPGGAAATPFDHGDNGVREEFISKVLNRSSAQYAALWSRLMFSGRGTQPKALASSAEVRKTVAADARAIGFMERSAADSSVKVVLTVR